MPQWNFIDRRKLPRYEITVPTRETDLGSQCTITSTTRDICEQGVGILSDEKLAVGATVQVCLKIPDNQEEIFVRGKVVWAKEVKKNQYRAGICLANFELSPVSLVLRLIKFGLKSRYYQ